MLEGKQGLSSKPTGLALASPPAWALPPGVPQDPSHTPFSVSGADPEETILNAFKVFDPEGKGVLKAD